MTVGNSDRRDSIDCDQSRKVCTLSMASDIEKIIIHEHYTEGNLRNDIGLIRLKEPITFSGQYKSLFINCN